MLQAASYRVSVDRVGVEGSLKQAELSGSSALVHWLCSGGWRKGEERRGDEKEVRWSEERRGEEMDGREERRGEEMDGGEGKNEER